ncbi:MAG: molybdenum cofactor biosynthesis protein B [Pseudomonadota bacterium]|nr:molybdenum cofactor biosynthesis protein B [Pseudomonadota bacterium]
MPEIDQSRAFVPINIAILTVSDTRTVESDKSGDLLKARIEAHGHRVVARSIVKDEIEVIQTEVKQWIESSNIDVVISTGGTGLTGRDVTPEAFKEIFEKEIEGFGELFRWLSFKKIGTSTIQSRAVAGVAGGTYIFALPGSTGACKDAWDEILQYQLDIRFRPCNFVEIMPRLREHELYGRAS